MSASVSGGRSANPSLQRLLGLLSTTIGQKQLMALTGVGLLGFLLVHMLGNLRVFSGPDALNGYAAWLQASPLLWPARLGLLGAAAATAWARSPSAWGSPSATAA